MRTLSAGTPSGVVQRNPRRLPLVLLGCLALLIALSGVSFAAPQPGTVSPHLRLHLLDPAFDPNATQGGAPFCTSGSLGTVLCYPPNFLKVAYDFPPTDGRNGLNGNGQTIVIVDAFGSPTLQSDLDTFDTTFGLPATKVQILCGPTWSGSSSDICPVNTIADLTTAPNSAVCGGAAGWAEETTLDVTQSHALAPGAKIVVVVANDCFDSSINDAEAAVVNQPKFRGSVMSQSFGEPDSQVDPTVRSVADGIYWTATKNNWTIIASSGDLGANEAGDTTLTPSWPATNPFNLAAGGTQGYPYGGQFGPPPGPGGVFTCPAHTNCNTGLVVINGGRYGCQSVDRPGVPTSCIPVGYGGEAAWNEADSIGAGTATGGGISPFYTRPLYQFFLPDDFVTLFGTAIENRRNRLNPDVSFNAAVNGGVLAYLGFLGRWAVFGGTSAASPAWAGIIALLNDANNRPSGFITPDIYAHWYDFHDIMVGNNSATGGQDGFDGFVAGPGYDLTTGLGTPSVSQFIRTMQFR